MAELVLLGKDGRETQVEVHSIGIKGPDGSFAGIHGATRDIWERERLERELRSSEERYRYLVSSSPDLVWVTDTEGRLAFVSDVAEAMLGVPAADLLGRPYAEVFAPTVRREAEVRFKWLSRHPTSVHRSRLPFRHADGHDVLVEINGIGMEETAAFVGRPRARPATSATATASSATSGARPASSRPARNAPTSPASSTTR